MKLALTVEPVLNNVDELLNRDVLETLLVMLFEVEEGVRLELDSEAIVVGRVVVERLVLVREEDRVVLVVWNVEERVVEVTRVLDVLVDSVVLMDCDVDVTLVLVKRVLVTNVLVVDIGVLDVRVVLVKTVLVVLETGVVDVESVVLAVRKVVDVIKVVLVGVALVLETDVDVTLVDVRLVDLRLVDVKDVEVVVDVTPT